MTWEISWADMCRICMEVEGVLVPLFNENLDDDGCNISDKLSSVAPVEIDKSDGLPNKVCTNCAQNINSFFEFRNLIIESDQKLRQMFDMQAVFEAENDCHGAYNILKVKDEGATTRAGAGDDIHDRQRRTNIVPLRHENMSSSMISNLEHMNDTLALVAEEFRENSNQYDQRNANFPSDCQNLADEYHSTQERIMNDKCASFLQNSDEQEDNLAKLPSAPVQKLNMSAKRVNALAVKSESGDSDSDSYVETEGNIVGSLNDTITKVKEIKEDGKVVQYQCTLCSQNYQKLSGALSHIVDLHVPITGPFYCVICEMDCDSIKQLKAHVKTHSGPTPYTCFLCKKSYILKRYLKRHMACHTDFPRHRCAKCGERFIIRSELEAHISSHADEGTSFKCSQCPREFAHKGNYKRHLITHLDPLGLHLPKFPCTVCHKRFMNNRTLETHMRVHTGEKPFHCELCGKSFSQQGNLLNHRKIHSNPRSFTCEICGKCFNQKSTLKDHSKLHSGEKPYVCNVCGKSFTFGAALRRHMWTHSEDKPYGCDVCDAKFTGKYDLKRHMKIHIGYHKKDPKPHEVDEANSIQIPEEIVNIFEDPSQPDTIFVEQIFLCDDAIQIVSHEDPEKENVDSLLELV